MNPLDLQRRWLQLATLTAAGAVFALDCTVDLGAAVPLFYVGVVWLAFFVRHARWMWSIAALVLVLNVAGFLVSRHSEFEIWTLLIHRGLAMIGIWLTALMFNWAWRLLTEQADLKQILESRVAERTAQLRASQERFELAVRGSTDGIWDWNVVSNEVYYSPRMKELVGFAEDEFPNVFATFVTHLHPDDRDWVLRAVDDHLQQHGPYDVEYRLRTKSGEYKWFRARGQAIWNTAGQALRMAGSITDVTERKRSEHALATANSQLAGVLNAATQVSIISTNVDGLITVFNSGAENLLGYTAEEMIGKQSPQIIHLREEVDARGEELSQELGYRVEGFEVFVAYAKQGRFDRRDWTYVRKDGSHFSVALVVTAVRNASGEMTGFLGVAEDITLRKQTEEQLLKAKESAESASRAKSSFLANMSHEIRTPMNGIIGMSQLLAQTDLRPHQRDYLATVEESAHILLRLLNDILAEQEFDLVLMDMQMPVLDGYEATAAIRHREHQTGGHIPIVAMTAEALKGDRERCLESGMDDYVTKPITPSEMYRAIENFPALCLLSDIGRRPASEPREVPAAPIAGLNCSASPAVEVKEEAGAPPAIDWNVARARLGQGSEVLREFSDLVTSQIPLLQAEIRRAIELRDFKLLRRSAHTLKGSVAYFGAQPLMQAALSLENRGRAESLDGVESMLAELEAELALTLTALSLGPPGEAS